MLLDCLLNVRVEYSRALRIRGLYRTQYEYVAHLTLTCVHRAGLIVDNIEKNVNNAEAYVDTGRVMVNKAKESQKSSRKVLVYITVL